MFGGIDIYEKRIFVGHSFKYENVNIYLQFIAANSFIYSAEYTKPTVQEKNIRFSNYLNTTAIRSAIYTRDVVYNVYTTPWPSEY